MTLLAALVLAQSSASTAAEFFPLVPGTRRSYEVKSAQGTTTLTDVVGLKPVYFDDQPAMAIVQKSLFNETLGTTYYRVDGPLVSIVGSAEDRSAATPNVGDTVDLTRRAAKKNVLMQLTPAMPVFRYEGKETTWVYGEVPVYRAIGDAEAIRTDKTLIKGTAKPGAARDVLGRKVDTIEVRVEVQLNEGRLGQKIVETSVYGRGIGLVEALRKTTADGRTQELRTRLVALEDAKGG